MGAVDDPASSPSSTAVPARAPLESVETLISRLSDPTASARREARDRLGKHGSAAAAAVPALLDGLKEEPVSEEAVRALGRIRQDPSRVIPALLKALTPKGRNWLPVREAAQSALIAYGSEAVPFIVAELQAGLDGASSWRGDPAFFLILARAGARAAPAVPELIRILKHEDSWMRGEAASTLGAIGLGAREAVPHLEAVLQNHEEATSTLGSTWVALRRIRGEER